MIDGQDGKSGLSRFVDWWLLLHIAIGGAMAIILPTTLQEASVTLLLPLAGIFVGLSFAWGGNAQALLQTEEIEDISKFNRGGFEGYIFAFQSAILLILGTLVLWGIAGLGIFDHVWPADDSVIAYHLIVFALFSLSSVTVRECWHVVIGAQQLLMMRYTARQATRKK